MVTNLASPPQSRPDSQPGAQRRWWVALWALPDVRWALAATALFGAALLVQLPGGPPWLWWPLYLGCYVAGGWEPGWAGLCALRERRLDVDLLMVVAAVGAAAIGQVMDGALLIVIFATSGALEAVATKRTEDSVRRLLDLAPPTASRLTADGETVVAAAALDVGDVIVVRPGERIGGDGEVIDGASEVDQATITGEPLPAEKQAGDDVFAGTLNGSGALRVRITRPAADTVIARIVTMVEQASATKARTQLFIDAVEQRYSVGMVAVTVALFVIPMIFGAPLQETLLRAMTFMIVASPCALVLATMPPMLSAIANAGRHGVLVKSAVVIEQLAGVTRVAFDKTGTLTEGRPRLVEVHRLPGSGSAGLTDDDVLAFAAGVEQSSEHPLSRAIVAAAREANLTVAASEDFTSAAGQGVAARVAGRFVEVGSPAQLLGPDQSDQDSHAGSTLALIAALEQAGQTAVVVRVDGRAVGVLGLADEVRPAAATTVERIAALTGTSPVLLTGDNARAAARLASQVGITDIRSGLLPQDKVTAVHDLEATGDKLAVVGDGVNDAPALAAAHSGIAMGRAGSDLALDTADVVITRDDLTTLPAVLGLARRARRLVVANLIIAATLIGGLVVWDLVGNLPLPLGVAGHEGSTIIVALNGLRLLRSASWDRAAQRRAGSNVTGRSSA